MNTFFSIILALVVFSIIVLIHEFGHFYVAKKSGILVEEFSLGMGPVLLSKNIGETLYSLRAFPLGGFCRMYGEDNEAQGDRAFNSKSVPVRMAVVFAGPFMNFVLAFVLIVALYGTNGFIKPEVAGLVDGYAAQEVGIQKGDTLTHINGQKIRVYEDLEFALMENHGEPVEIKVKRENEVLQFSVMPKLAADGSGRFILGFNPLIRNGFSAKPLEGIEKAGLLETAVTGYHTMGFYLRQTVAGLVRVFTFNVEPEEVSGPIGITKVIGESYESGMKHSVGAAISNLAHLAALISVNLGAINLFPIPALDGGRLVFLAVEGVRRKPIDRNKEGFIHFIGFVFVMALMVFVAYNDISKLFLG